MVNKKQALRLGTFLAILMFLLIPLLSSPVAAAFTVTTNSTTTAGGAGGPTATQGLSGQVFFFQDVVPRTATFQVWYTMIDFGTVSGSDHFVQMTITQTTPPGPTTIVPLTIFVPPATTVGPALLSTTIPYAASPTTWTWRVDVSVLDISSGVSASAWGTATVNV